MRHRCIAFHSFCLYKYMLITATVVEMNHPIIERLSCVLTKILPTRTRNFVSLNKIFVFPWPLFSYFFAIRFYRKELKCLQSLKVDTCIKLKKIKFYGWLYKDCVLIKKNLWFMVWRLQIPILFLLIKDVFSFMVLEIFLNFGTKNVYSFSNRKIITFYWMPNKSLI